MEVLIIGGTGLISTGIVKHLVARGADVTLFNRGQRENTAPAGVRILRGDRENSAEFSALGKRNWDVVIDMICFNPEQADADIQIFAGHTAQLIFCSTVCTYGIKSPPSVFVDETFPQEPISGYGRNKLTCEQRFLKAHAEGKFKLTIVRPSSTYGPGGALLDNLEGNSASWDRIIKGKPVLCAGDGLGLWVSTYRDDVGKLFAYAGLNPKTYGQAYNATRPEHLTWRQYYQTVAEVLGQSAQVLFMPADWIWRHDPQRFGLLREITAFHGAYSSEKARRDVSEFTCETDFAEGASLTLHDVRRRAAWRSCDDDQLYDTMVNKALAIGMEPVIL